MTSSNTFKGLSTDITAPWVGSINTKPRTLTDKRAKELYGNPTDEGGGPSKDWVLRNTVECHGDKVLVGRAGRRRERLPGVPERLYVTVHAKVEAKLRLALERVAQVAHGFQIGRLGCHNYRNRQSDPDADLSIHAYAAAVDINSAANAAKRFEAGQEPAPWSAAWLELWPPSKGGIIEPVVLAFESCGWAWGGRWRRYVDPMHFELVEP